MTSTSLRRWLHRLTFGLTAACGAAVAAEDVPFITTPDNVTLAMLQLARVGAHDHVIDLGSGDGRIVITAAKRFGASGTGVEIVPELVKQSRLAARKAGVAKRVAFIEQDLFKADLGKASVVTLYLLPEVNLQLRPRLLALRPGTRIVSHDWDMGDWPPERTLEVDAPDKKVGREKKSKLYLWVVPAQLDGLWCGTGMRKRVALRFEQRYKNAHASLKDFDMTIAFDAHIEATRISVSDASGSAVLQWQGGRLSFVEGRGAFASWRGTSFERARGPRCA